MKDVTPDYTEPESSSTLIETRPAAEPNRRGSFFGLWARTRPELIVCILLAFASALVGFVHVPQHVMVSPIDEYVYIDYLVKVPDQGIVYKSEETGDFARRYLACHGVRFLGTYPEQLCKATTTSANQAYPNAGKTTADLYTPLYFVTTWALAQPLTWFGIDLVDAGRFVGVLWLALAAIALFRAMRRLLIPRILAAGLGFMLIGSLPAYWSNTYVSTDATGLAAAAVLLLIGLRVRDGHTNIGWFVILSVIFTLFKMQNLLAVLAVALVLLLDQLQLKPPGRNGTSQFSRWVRRPPVWGSLLAVALSLLGQGIWLVIRGLLAVGPTVTQGVGSPLTAAEFTHELFLFIPGIANGALDPKEFGAVGILLAGVLTILVSGGVVGSIGAFEPLSLGSNVGVSLLVIATVSAPVLALAAAVSSGEYVPLVSRYGLSLLPLCIAACGLLFTKRKALHIVFMALGLAMYVLSLLIRG